MADRVEQSDDWGHVEEQEEGFAIPPFLHFLLDPLGVLKRRWPWMLLILLLGLAAAGVLTYTVEPTYRAAATLLISRQKIPEDFVRSTVREDTIANLDAMAGSVLSQTNLKRLIEQLDLFADRPADTSDLELVRELTDSIHVGPIGNFRGAYRGQEDSLIYGIEYSSTDPNEAARVANALAALFMEASIERRSSQARLTTAFLRRQLSGDEAELRDQSQAVAEFRRENRGMLPEEQETTLRRLDLLSAQRRSLAAEVSAKENRIVTLESQPRLFEASTNEVLLGQLRADLARESAVHTDEHPNVVALRERVARMEKVVEEEHRERGGGAPPQVAAERREIDTLTQRIAEIDGQIKDLNARVDAMPKIGEQLAVLGQKEQVLRERYLESLRKVEGAELAENLESAQQGAQVSMLDSARAPTSPEQPRWVVGVGGVAISFALALALGVLLELVDPVVLDVAQLEELAGQPCLGGLPQNV